jgi:chromosome condensin MukBEF complex kleisin-like MukF subunit
MRTKLDNFLLIIIIGEEENKKLQTIIDRYEKQVKVSAGTLKNNQDTLQVARDDLQKLKLENTELRHEVELLEKRTEELYAQVNTMV